MDELDHRYLNEKEEFKTQNPSSENIARFIFDRLATKILEASGGQAKLHSVSAWESDNACAKYVPDGEF